MDKPELEKLIQEVLVEEGIIGDISGAVVTGQLGQVVKDFGKDMYDSTVGRVIFKVNKEVTKAINKTALYGVGLDKSFRDLAIFVISEINSSDASLIGTIGFKKTGWKDYFEEDTDERRIYNDAMGSVSLSNPLLFNEAWVAELSNPDNYNVVDIGATATKNIDKLKAPVAKDTAAAMIYNQATIKSMAARINRTSDFQEEGKHFNLILKHYYKIGILKNLRKLIAKDIKKPVGYVDKNIINAIQSLKDEEVIKDVQQIRKGIAKKVARALLYSISDEKYILKNSFYRKVTESSMAKAKAGSSRKVVDDDSVKPKEVKVKKPDEKEDKPQK